MFGGSEWWGNRVLRKACPTCIIDDLENQEAPQQTQPPLRDIVHMVQNSSVNGTPKCAPMQEKAAGFLEAAGFRTLQEKNVLFVLVSCLYPLNH